MKSFFLQLTKMDAFQGIATGIAACEEVDHDAECLDYAGSKPYFKQWSATQLANSGGKSYGNVRLQHDPRRVVGKLLSMDFDDQNKRVLVSAKIVDPVAKQMLAEGVLTGFSIGGDYISKTPMGGGIVSYIASPCEISVCDRPCSPSATYQSVKTDGSMELRKFLTRDSQLEAGIRIAKAAGWSDSYICDSLQVTSGRIWQVMRKMKNSSTMIERRRALIESGRVVR